MVYQCLLSCYGFNPDDLRKADAIELVIGQGAKRVKNYLKTLNMELTTVARACGKSNVHHLEREDLVALTIEAAAMARIPLAGTDWIPGHSRF